MKKLPRRRWLAVALTALLAIGTASATTACDPSSSVSWRLGNTHGAIVEMTAGRASLGIYRVPTQVLYAVFKKSGIRAAQDAIWSVGQPPAFTKTFTYRGRSITTSFGTKALRSWTHALIYDDPADIRGALIDAHAGRNCLALTLVSYGVPTKNWTTKQVGCREGAL